MAAPLEQDVMKAIGLGAHYSWFNGSGSCDYIRRHAVEKLEDAAKASGLQISPEWLEVCKTATRVDQVNSKNYGLTNTWIACSYAIQDAVYRSESGPDAGFSPAGHEWRFWSDTERNQWERMQAPSPRHHGMFRT